jgi:hypothetical protein
MFAVWASVPIYANFSFNNYLYLKNFLTENLFIILSNKMYQMSKCWLDNFKNCKNFPKSISGKFYITRKILKTQPDPTLPSAGRLSSRDRMDHWELRKPPTNMLKYFNEMSQGPSVTVSFFHAYNMHYRWQKNYLQNSIDWNIFVICNVLLDLWPHFLVATEPHFSIKN